MQGYESPGYALLFPPVAADAKILQHPLLDARRREIFPLRGFVCVCTLSDNVPLSTIHTTTQTASDACVMGLKCRVTFGTTATALRSKGERHDRETTASRRFLVVRAGSPSPSHGGSRFLSLLHPHSPPSRHGHGPVAAADESRHLGDYCPCGSHIRRTTIPPPPIRTPLHDKRERGG